MLPSGFGTLSYSLSAIAFAVLTMLLLTSWKGRLQGALLIAAVAGTALWATVLAYAAMRGTLGVGVVFGVELLRDVLWVTFLYRLVGGPVRRSWQVWALLAAWVGFGGVVTVAGEAGALIGFRDQYVGQFPLLVLVGLCAAALLLVIQIYARAHQDLRWRIKFLCVGLSGLFVYDLWMYSQALLFYSVADTLWSTRGFVSTLIAPLIMVTAARNVDWSLDVFVSRTFALRSFTFLAVGSYLLMLAGVGYLLEEHGGEWGAPLRVILLACAILLLVVALMSGEIRARLKVALSKHFYNYKYDYRDEWLRLTNSIADKKAEPDLSLRAILCLAQIVDSRGGLLLQRNDEGQFMVTASLDFDQPCDGMVANAGMVRFIQRSRWVINIHEFRENPRQYKYLQLPEWLDVLPYVWLIVPLFHSDALTGIIVLVESRAPRQLNWEDYDLLKTASYQVGSELEQAIAADALASAKQFEAYNRVSAFIMHDLKNVIGQLSLVVENGRRLRGNQEFVDDAFETVDNVVLRTKRLLNQLKHSREMNLTSHVDIVEAVRRVVKERALVEPVPEFDDPRKPLKVIGHPDRLGPVIGNVIHNAQDATPAEGHVWVSVKSDVSGVVVRVEDDGEGMTEQFLRKQLFKPFVSTKDDSGMGIGAFEAKEYIEKLGGSISVQSEKGRGTVVYMRFPKVHTDTVERVA